MKLNWRVWLLIILMIFSVISIINFQGVFQQGVLIKNVEINSTASEQGLFQSQIITSLNEERISSIEDYEKFIQENFPSSEKIKLKITTNEGDFIMLTNQAPEIVVSQISRTTIKTGLDLSGGARALVQAENHSLTSEEVIDLASVLNNRLNVYGIEDVQVVPALDLEGNNRIRIEIAGATPNDLEKLVGEQGKFEAKIGNETVFTGGDKDIASVGRDAQNARITSCSQAADGSYYCKFTFTVTLSAEAAKRHAEITDKLEVDQTSGGNYLSKKLDLYLDGTLVDSLLIGESLKGQITTQISISGSGEGETTAEASDDAEASMKNLQTILITGSLPYKLEIVKLDTISPSLGDDFVKFILIAGFIALISASIIVFVRYRNLKSSLMVILFSASEIILILGVASLISWNLDLASIAGILATIGTGFDDQIVILDETKTKKNLSMAQRFKRAFAIIMGAYFTSFVSLIPLVWAGAGLLKGFAFTTIIGISIGVFITRPAFSDVIKKLEE